MRKLHELKSWPEVFDPVWDEVKGFDYRLNDRNYKVDDLLYQREFDPISKEYTGRELLVTITYVLLGGKFGIPDGYVIVGFARPLRLKRN